MKEREQGLKVRSQHWTEFLRDNHPGNSVESVQPFLKEDSFEKALKAATAASEHFLMTDIHAHQHVDGLIRATCINVPVEVALEYAACRTSASGSLPNDDLLALEAFFDYVVLPVIRSQQEMMRYLIQCAPGLSPVNRLVLEKGVRLAALFDQLFAVWRKKVAIPYQLGLRQAPQLKDAVKQACQSSHRSKYGYGVLIQ